MCWIIFHIQSQFHIQAKLYDRPLISLWIDSDFRTEGWFRVGGRKYKIGQNRLLRVVYEAPDTFL